jgi:hypothetical protein
MVTDPLGRFAFGCGRFGSFSAAGRDIGLVDPFGFSWRLAVWLRRRPLMSLGFSWISLDSLVRNETFQWVTPVFRQEYFSRFFSMVLAAQGRKPAVLGHAEAPDCSWAQA